MKILIAIIVIIILSGLGYKWFATSSKVPEGIERADVEATNATGVATSTDSNVGVSATSSGATVGADLSITIGNATYQAQDFTFQFTGYGPGGKQEVGTFKKISIGDIKTDTNGNPVSGKLIIKADTVSTGKAGLDKHLCAEDFFNCAKYPNITFTYKNIAWNSSTEATVTGLLDFNGVQKDVSFKVTRSGLSASADFLLDTTPFNIKYTGVNKEVRIKFAFKVAIR